MFSQLNCVMSWMWWHTIVIPTLKRLGEETHLEFKVTLGYIVSSSPD